MADNLQQILDIINTTLPQLRGPLIKAWVQAIPTLDAIRKAKKVGFEGGTYIERDLSGGPSAKGIAIRAGTERNPVNYTNTIRQLAIKPFRVRTVLPIPRMWLAHNMGKEAIIKIIDEKPKEQLMGFAQDLNQWLATGTCACRSLQSVNDIKGFITLNGQYTGGTDYGASDGLLDFAAPASQTDTVENLAKSNSTYNHYNQYGLITAWATNGLKTLRKVYRKAAFFDESQAFGKGPDLLLMDEDTYGNLEETLNSLVRTAKIQDKVTEPDKDFGLPFENGFAYPEPTINRADTTAFNGAPANGVTYMLNTEFWEACWTKGGEPNISDFMPSGMDFDGIYAEFIAHGNFICKKLVAQAAVAGGAN